MSDNKLIIINEKNKTKEKTKEKTKIKTKTKTKTKTVEKNNNDKINSNYSKMELKEHIEKRPDTYIGSIEFEQSEQYIYNNENNGIELKKIKMVPGFCNINEEILVNSIDNNSRVIQRNKNLKGKDKLKSVTEIRINIDKTTGQISVYNNGEGIDIVKHPKEKVYVPQMIFGELLTSGNYNMDEEKITGGKNGFGAKLTNIYSKFFQVETVDHRRKLYYSQIFKENLNIKQEPIIKPYKKEPFTRITYIPDYKRFGMSHIIDDDIIGLFKKRAYDLIPCSDGKISVYFNDEKIEINDFKDYMGLYIKSNNLESIQKNTDNVSEEENIIDEESTDEPKRDMSFPIIYRKINERWSIGMCLNPTLGFKQISFVNGINTTRGGKHVDYIVKQITSHLIYSIEKKKKVVIKDNMIKENIMIFLVSTIVNPSFDSQTKETLTTNKGKFGSECIIPTKLIDELGASGVINRAINLNIFHDKQLLSKTDGRKKGKLTDIEKLDDAKFAGTKNSSLCTLILTEGDSAKVSAVAGVSEISKGRDLYGIYPLKGKLLNTRGDGKEKMIANNKEITELKRILGLQEGKEYKDIESLRYGKIMIMTDQDVDGSHIKGLIINFISSRWPSLLQIDEFLINFLTPIVKIKKKNTESSFYNLYDFNEWYKNNNNGKGYTIKYYKGLGTSSPKESKEYFKTPKHLKYTYDDTSINAIDLAFNSKRADDRKEWLGSYDQSNIIKSIELTISYKDFIDKELIHFSNYDNQRNIPSIYDGLKPSQRKILYCCFKRNLTKEIRVAQLAGYVSEHGAYHHGEMSLNSTIVSMAQNYVGAKNINLLEPNGQFGSRLKGGKDSAQPRYIHTLLTKITNIIFDKKDEPLYNYTTDDGENIEPYFYVPIVPVILINGADGIGTGWSSGIPKFNPIDIISNIKRLIKDEPIKEMVPWYRGFLGKIKKIARNSWKTYGKYAIVDDNTIIITELPIGMWTDNFKVLLDSLILNPITNDKDKMCFKEVVQEKIYNKNIYFLKDYINNSSESQIHFILKFDKGFLNALLTNIDKDGVNKFESVFKMHSKISCNKKLNLYNSSGKLVTFNSPEEILKEYYDMRLKYYMKRHTYLVNELKKTVLLIKIKVRFILDIINSKILINNKSKQNIYTQLETNKYPKMFENVLYELNKENIKYTKMGDYDFLIRMPIYNLTKEKIQEFKNELDKVQSELDKLEQKTIYNLWMDDLAVFEKEYTSFTNKYYKYMGFDVSLFKKQKTRKLKLKDHHNVNN
jgi:DNA topoisomerase II